VKIKSCYDTFKSSYSFRTALVIKNWWNVWGTDFPVSAISPVKISALSRSSRVLVFLTFGSWGRPPPEFVERAMA